MGSNIYIVEYKSPFGFWHRLQYLFDTRAEAQEAIERDAKNYTVRLKYRVAKFKRAD